MNTDDKNRLTPKELEDLGIPQFQGDPVGMNNIIFKMYDKMDSPDRKFSPWLRLLIIFFALIVLFIPGFFLLCMVITTGINSGDIDLENVVGVLIPLVLGFLLFGAGCRLIYANVKALLKKHPASQA